MDILFRDLRYGIRSLLKSPAFTVVVTTTLALGIGLNTAIFSVVYAVLINPLPFKDSKRVVMIWKSNPGFGQKHGEASLPEYLDWKQQNHTLEDIAAFREGDLNLTGGGTPERIVGAVVTASFFDVLNTSPIVGRSFSAEDNQPGANNVVLLSFGLWNRRFARDSSITGKRILLDDKGYTIVGVMPPSVKLRGRAADVWIPVAFDEASMNRRLRSFKVIGRLAPTVDLKRAQSDMTLIAERLAQTYRQTNAGAEVTVVPLHEEIVGNIKSPLLILFGAAGIVLLIACANAVNLLLSRTVAREKEISIRAALGASRLRIIRHFIIESLLLALLGGALGLLLSSWAMGLLDVVTRTNVPRSEEISFSVWSIVFTLIVSLLIGISCGLLSAQQVSKFAINELLKAESRTLVVGHRGRIRSLLLLSEVALSCVLLIGAGLLVRSFQRLWNTNTGFNPTNLLTLELSLSELKYPETYQQAAFCRQTLEQIALVPGVQSAAVASSLPILGVEAYTFLIEGRSLAADAEPTTASRQAVSPDYFHTMGIPLIKGRVFSDKDINGQPEVTIINRTMARLYWGDADPIGKRIKIDSWMSIIGVVEDVRESGLELRPEPEFYVAYFQYPASGGFLVVRSVSNLLDITTAVQSAILNIDKNQPIANVRTMEDILAESVSQRRFILSLIGVFATLAFILASIGVYGVISYSLSQRTREIGIRIALGAQPRDVLKLALGQTMVYVMVGVGFGLVAAVVSTRLMSSLLYEVSPTDPPTFIIVSLLLIGVSLLASYIPARKAMKIPPLAALRYE